MTDKAFEEWATDHGVVAGTEEYLLCWSAWQSGRLALVTEMEYHERAEREKLEKLR